MQAAPTGQSAVAKHACGIWVQKKPVRLFVQYRPPLIEVYRHSQSVGQVSWHTWPQLPLPRQVLGAAQAGQLTAWPQLLAQTPQRPAQVVPAGCG
jgi:hypothetical protein